MKKLILFPLLFIVLPGLSQGPNWIVDYTNNQPVINGDLNAVKVPLTLKFTKNYSGKHIELFGEGQSLTGKLEFGKNDLQLKNDTFYFEITAAKKTNPGGHDVDYDQLKMELAGKSFTLVFAGPGETDGGQKGPTIEENYQAGIMYYDALKLADVQTSVQTRITILKAYELNVGTRLKDNPFLNEFFGKGAVKVALDKDANKPEGAFSAAAFVSGIGNMDVTNLVAGLAHFLAERTKEELNETFFRHMKEQLEASPELSTAFPKTTAFLKVIETYSYASILQVLKEAFETDIQHLPENLYGITTLTESHCNGTLLKKDKLQDCQERLQQLQAFFGTREGRWTKLGMFTVKEAMAVANPADLLSAITHSSDLEEIKKNSTGVLYNDYNLSSSIELTNFLSQSLLSREEGQVWVNAQQLSVLAGDEKKFRIYLGLLLAMEQNGKVKIIFYKDQNNTISFGEVLKAVHHEYQKYAPEIKNLVKNAHNAYNSANSAIKKIAAAVSVSTQPDAQALYDYYKTFTASLKPIAESRLLQDLVNKDLGSIYGKIIAYLDPAVDMAYHIAGKKYSAAIYDAVMILGQIKPKAGEKDQMQLLKKSFVKYGTVISTVAGAQSSDEVKEALEASVLPVGSSAIKRNSLFSITLNAYVGGFYGWNNAKINDTTYSATDTTITTRTQVYRSTGLYAPIGVSFSWGLKKCGAISLNAQLFDVGALVNFYLLKDNQTNLPDNFTVKLSNVFAPGGSVSYNILNSPLSLMGGVQFVPALNNVNQVNTSAGITASNAWRWQIGLVVDIPMFNIKVSDFKR